MLSSELDFFCELVQDTYRTMLTIFYRSIINPVGRLLRLHIMCNKLTPYRTCEHIARLEKELDTIQLPTISIIISSVASSEGLLNRMLTVEV